MINLLGVEINPVKLLVVGPSLVVLIVWAVAQMRGDWKWYKVARANRRRYAVGPSRR